MRRTAKCAGIVAIVLLMPGRLTWASAPVIKGWSSSGGHPLNKDNPKDRMYLVKGGDKITFTVKAEGAEKYIWQVNKKVQKGADRNTFTFTVPNEKGIWEIHVKVIGNGSEVHTEWVISTLSKAQAPDFFDYFTDKENPLAKVQRQALDPWNRPLPKWRSTSPASRIDTSACMLRRLVLAQRQVILSRYTDIFFGTWRFKWLATGDGSKPWFGGDAEWYVLADRNSGPYLEAEEEGGGHRYMHYRGSYTCDRVQIDCTPYALYMRDPAIYKDKWHTTTIIRTKEGIAYRWVDGVLMPECMAEGTRENPPENSAIMFFCLWSSLGQSTHVDCLEAYRDRYLWPEKVVVGEYPHGWIWGEHHKLTPVDVRKGLFVQGHNITLQRIAKLANNPKLFEYDENEKTAIAHTNLCILGGTTFVMNGQTLLMDSKPGEELEIRVENGAILKLINSRIDSTSQSPWYWAITSAVNTQRFNNNRGYVCYNFNGKFIAKGCTFNNFGHLFLDSAQTITIEDTKFTNVVEVDRGVYMRASTFHKRRYKILKGKKGLWFSNGLPLTDFTVRNIVIKGKDKPTTLTSVGFDMTGMTTIYDSVLENVKVSKVAIDGTYCSPSRLDNRPTKGSELFKPYPGRRRWHDLPVYLKGSLNLINCKFDKFIVGKYLEDGNKFGPDETKMFARYYLDVTVKDTNGQPVVGAKVTVKNEVNKSVPAQNLEKWTQMTSPHSETGRVSIEQLNKWKINWFNFPRWYYGRKNSATFTGPDGHTPLPRDKTRTMVLTDFVLNKTGKKEFAYTITVEKDGKKKVITGVNPGPEWYRPDRNKPTYTIVAVLDGKTVTEAELKRAGLAGKIK